MYLRRLDLSPDGPPPPAHYIIFVIIFIYIFCAVHLRMVLGRHYCCSGRVPGERQDADRAVPRGRGERYGTRLPLRGAGCRGQLGEMSMVPSVSKGTKAQITIFFSLLFRGKVHLYYGLQQHVTRGRVDCRLVV